MSLPDREDVLGPGDFFGALAEFGMDEAYKAHIQADTECRLLILDLDDFNHLLTQWPELREAIRAVKNERLSSPEKKDAED